MNRILCSVLPGLLLVACAELPGRELRAQGAYPRVYGPSGAQYGPTQAHYQYERQYGRPWHGQGGVRSDGYYGHSHYGHYGHGHYGHNHYGYGLPVYPGYFSYGIGPVQGYVGVFGGGYAPPLGLSVAQPYPLYVGQDPFQNNTVLEGTLEENRQQWGEEGFLPENAPVQRPVRRSSPEAQQRAVRLIGQADVWFRKQSYAQAHSRYKQASATAADLALPHFRLGFTLAAMRQYDSAVSEIKRGLALDPTWPVTGESLSELFGEEQRLAQTALLHEVGEWVRQDIRSPDRLFLLGVLLTFDGEADQARQVFEAAARLGNSPEHVLAFLNPPEDINQIEEPQARPIPKRAKPVVAPVPAPTRAPAAAPDPARVPRALPKVAPPDPQPDEEPRPEPDAPQANPRRGPPPVEPPDVEEQQPTETEEELQDEADEPAAGGPTGPAFPNPQAG